MKLLFLSWRERDAKEELMVLRVLEKEGTMEIISIFILLFPENGGPPALAPVKCSFKKGKAPSPQKTSCIISKPFHPVCEYSKSLEA